jgi:hypothetical protein
VAVLSCNAVKATVVNTHTQRTVCLLDKEHWGTIGGCAGFDELFGKKVVELLLQFV